MVSKVEEWRPLIGWEGLYEISTAGRVRSISRVIEREWRGRSPYSFVREGLVLQRVRAGSAQASVNLFKPGHPKELTRRVADLMIETFGLAIPPTSTLVFRNGDVADCSLANLAIVEMTEPGEEWRDIPDTPRFQVSSFARVRSLTGFYDRRHRGKIISTRIFGRILSPRLSNKAGKFLGYPCVNISRPGYRSRNVPVHHLVAYAFIGPRPDGLEICHRDGDSHNAVPPNLYYGTRRQNLNDVYVAQFAKLAGISVAEAWEIVASKKLA